MAVIFASVRVNFISVRVSIASVRVSFVSKYGNEILVIGIKETASVNIALVSGKPVFKLVSLVSIAVNVEIFWGYYIIMSGKIALKVLIFTNHHNAMGT